MTYRLMLTELAEEDLRAILDDCPSRHRRDLLDAIETELLTLAENPRIAAQSSRPFRGMLYRMKTVAGNTTRYYTVAFHYSDDEASIVIVQVKRMEF